MSASTSAMVTPAVGVLVLCASTFAMAQEGLQFHSVPEVIPSARVQLVNGSTIDDVDIAVWSAVALARTVDGRLCTSTLVGPRVLLTAAHCVDAMDSADKARTLGGTVTFGGSEIPIIECNMHPSYANAEVRSDDLPRSSEDYALCELAAPINDVTQESVETDPIDRSKQVLLTGYGCTTIEVNGNKIQGFGTDLNLRIGDASIDALGVSDHTDKPGVYLRSKSDGGQPVLCPGDSGGPAFSGASTSKQDGPKRRVLAVNSKVMAVPQKGGHTFFSFAASLLDPSFRSFQSGWTRRVPDRRKVCGIDVLAGTGNCRQ